MTTARPKFATSVSLGWPLIENTFPNGPTSVPAASWMSWTIALVGFADSTNRMPPTTMMSATAPTTSRTARASAYAMSILTSYGTCPESRAICFEATRGRVA